MRGYIAEAGAPPVTTALAHPLGGEPDIILSESFDRANNINIDVDVPWSSP